MATNLTHAVDLHVHSTRSDGTLTPTELVNYAVEKGLRAFALTDHDTVSGLDEALMAAKGKPIRVIPGIEFSTEYYKKDVHIVGLFIDYTTPVFKEYLDHFIASREERNNKLCAKLRTAANIAITYEDLVNMFPNAVITRAHYAKYLLEHGYVKSLSEAFERYLGDHTPYYIPRQKVTPEKAIALILSAKGIPVLAHPTLYHLGNSELDKLVHRLKDAGLVAIEGIYSTYDARDTREIHALADKYGLLISGGSDFHGANKPNLDLGNGYGKLFIPEQILKDLEDYRNHLERSAVHYEQ